MNMNRFLDKCMELNMEINPANDGSISVFKVGAPKSYNIVCSKTPTKEQVKEITELAGEGVVLTFIPMIKNSTFNIVATCLTQYGCILRRPRNAELKNKEWHIKAVALKPDEGDESVINRINKTLIADGYLDQWTIEIDEEMKGSYNRLVVKELEDNNKTRGMIIMKDDISNLKITLGTCKSSQEFIDAI